jgi:hypothetical protein
MNFQDQLKKLDACGAAREWVGDKTLEEAWSTCTEHEWMFWLAGRTVDSWPIVEVAYRIAESVLGLVPEGEDRPAKAIEASRRWVADPTEENASATLAASRAAHAASDAASSYVSLAASAAYYSARAAYAAYYSARAAYAAADPAAFASHYPYASYASSAADHAYLIDDTSDTEICDIIRSVITAADVSRGLK